MMPVFPVKLFVQINDGDVALFVAKYTTVCITFVIDAHSIVADCNALLAGPSKIGCFVRMIASGIGGGGFSSVVEEPEN